MSTNPQAETAQRSLRGSRGRQAATRGNPSERPKSPRNNSPSPKSPKEEESSRPIRGSRGSRAIRPRGRGRVIRRDNPRSRPYFQRRFRRPLNFIRNRRRGRRGGFRPRTRNFRNYNRLPGNRSIFIKGFPLRMSESTITEMLRKEGRVLRVTLLKDNRGESRGMAFAEFQYPREAYNVVQKYKGKKYEGNDIFVAFKRNNRFRNNNPRFFNRNRNIRQFNNFRPGFNPNRYQMPMRSFRGGVRGRGRGRGRGF